MVERARERVAVADVDAGVFAQTIGDIHGAGTRDGFVGVRLVGIDLGNEEDVLEVILVDQLLALLDHAHAV